MSLPPFSDYELLSGYLTVHYSLFSGLVWFCFEFARRHSQRAKESEGKGENTPYWGMITLQSLFLFLYPVKVLYMHVHTPGTFLKLLGLGFKKHGSAM